MSADWSRVRLDTIATVSSGGSAPQDPRYFGGPHRFVRVSHLDADKHAVIGFDPITDEAVRDYGLRLFPAGTIVLPKSGASVRLEKRAVLPFDSYLVSHLAAIQPHPEGVDPEFLFFGLIRQRLAEGKLEAYPTLRISDIRATEIPLPSVAEQRVIARTLRAIQDDRARNDRVIQAVKSVKAALAREVFSAYRGESGDVSWIPLRQIAQIGNGSTPKRDKAAYWEGGTIPWLTSGKAHDTVITAADEFVTPVARRECHLPLVPAGSLVIAITGQGKTRGLTALLDVDACISQHLAYVRFTHQEVAPEFMLEFLATRYENLRTVSASGGSTKAALTCAFLRTYEVPLPSLAEQRLVARRLQTVNDKIAAETQRARTIDGLMESGLERLMAGTEFPRLLLKSSDVSG